MPQSRLIEKLRSHESEKEHSRFLKDQYENYIDLLRSRIKNTVYMVINKLLESVNNRSKPLAHLAELVDALVLGTSDFGRGSSSLPVGIFELSCTGLT